MPDTTNLRQQRLSLFLDMRQNRGHHFNPPTIEPLEDRRLMSVAMASSLTGSFTGSFTGHLPSTLPVAGTSHVTVHLKNSGGARAVEPVTLQVFASTTPVPNADDLLLATTNLNLRLAPRAAVNTKITVPSPTTLLTGSYYLLAEANGALVTATPVNIQAPFSDLAISFAGLPSQPIEIDGYSAGRRVATLNVTNDGNVPVNGKVNLSLYISADNTLDTNATLLQTVSNAKIALKPGQSKAVRFQIAVPPGTAIGGYFLLAKANGVGSLASVTTNNSVTVSSRRVAVVGQLPTPININNNTYINVYTDGAEGAVVDDGGYVDTSGSADPVIYADSGNGLGDTNGAADTGSTSISASGGDSSASSSSSDSSSSDDGDISDSSGGDF